MAIGRKVLNKYEAPSFTAIIYLFANFPMGWSLKRNEEMYGKMLSFMFRIEWYGYHCKNLAYMYFQTSLLVETYLRTGQE